MIAEAIGFVLRNLPAFLLVLALLVAALHRGRGSTPERFLPWLLLLPVGVTALWAAVFHLFFPSVAAADIGWEVSPFQFEAGMADLAIGATAFASFWCSLPFKAAAVWASSIFLLGGAVGRPRSSDARGRKIRARQRWRPVFHGHNLSRGRYRPAGSRMAALPGWHGAAQERLTIRQADALPPAESFRTGREPSMRRRDTVDDDSLPVMVPRSDKVLVPTSAIRVRRLREHLIKALRELRTEKQWARSASPARPDPAGFPARVAQRACSLCKGWCSRNGDDDAFLDDRTMARVRLAMPDMDERAVLLLYLDLVPPVAYRDSAIFHGKWGCSLDRSLRADVCNSYYCGALGTYMKTGAAIPTKVIAGEGDKMQTSPVLMP
jgi:uncharacterized protein DUF6790